MNHAADHRESATPGGLSPLPVRLAVYALLVALAFATIKLIDDRAMIRMREFEERQRNQHETTNQQPGR